MNNNHLNIKLKHVKPSATLVINEYSLELIKQGIEVFKFGFGQSPFSCSNKNCKSTSR